MAGDLSNIVVKKVEGPALVSRNPMTEETTHTR